MERVEASKKDDALVNSDVLDKINWGEEINIRGGALFTGTFVGLIFGLLLRPVYSTWNGESQWVVFAIFIVASFIGALLLVKWKKFDMG